MYQKRYVYVDISDYLLNDESLMMIKISSPYGPKSKISFRGEVSYKYWPNKLNAY